MLVPTIFELLDDPIYRAYVKRVPRLAPNLRHGNPWQVWALTPKGTWKGGQFATYQEGWQVVVKAVRNRSVLDISLVSRRQLFAPPPGFTWALTPKDRWCPRCRRPSTFKWSTRTTHHALRALPALASDDRYCCMYCGIRRAAIPLYSPAV